VEYNEKEGFDVFQEIADFWSFQLNNEIYLRNHPGVPRGSKEYFEIILAARRQFIYYFSSMISYLKEAPSRDLLEVGCGMGTDSLVLAQEGFDITGIDLAPAHLELAESLFEYYHLTGRFMEGNAEDLPFPNDRFGCVYSFGVLHHTPNTWKAIQEIYRVLSPEGRAVIMLYHEWSLNNFAHWISRKGFENVKNGKDSPVTYRFSKNEVRKMCSDFSACDIHTEYLFGAGWGKIYNITPKPIYSLLSKLIGWHLVVYVRK
jgi:SAM-dependent methyltransferase